MPLKLLKGIRHFKNNAFVENKNLFSTLTGGQNPDILFITCSDSRIIPSSITHAEYGDLFVIRNAGNIIPPYSNEPSGEAATIEYALKKLHVKEIIICGHSQCGAMQGLLDPQPEEHLPAVASWLKYAQPALSRVKEKPSTFDDNPHSKLVHTTQENILVQIENLKTHPAVKEKLANRQLLLHAWFYDIKCGEIFIYNHESNTFIPFEEAVTEVFNSELVHNKMQVIIEEEAIKYLNTLTNPKTAALFLQTRVILDQVALKGVGPIWEHINKSARLRLWAEFGDLCEDLKGCIDPRFTELLEKAQDVKVSGLKPLHRRVSQSPGFIQYCGGILRTISVIQSPGVSIPKQDSQDRQNYQMAKL